MTRYHTILHYLSSHIIPSLRAFDCLLWNFTPSFFVSNTLYLLLDRRFQMVAKKLMRKRNRGEIICIKGLSEIQSSKNNKNNISCQTIQYTFSSLRVTLKQNPALLSSSSLIVLFASKSKSFAASYRSVLNCCLILSIPSRACMGRHQGLSYKHNLLDLKKKGVSHYLELMNKLISKPLI